MNIADLIGVERVILNLRAWDKGQLLEELSRLAASFTGASPSVISRALQAREQLGSTGVGRGVALPHARIAGVERLVGMFVRLSRPLEFQAIDDKPVDLVFLLLIPANAGSEHVAALAAISRKLRDKEVAERLRKADNAQLAYQVLTSTYTSPLGR